jgi:predicted dehydrogenase
MCIDKQGFALMLEAFDSAAEQGVLLYDIMTERSEINTILQKVLMHDGPLFGELSPGSLDAPAVELESVHHLFKYVSGRPLVRPGWAMDTSQQGEGIVDVTTHLVDLAVWQCFPGVAIDYHKDIEVLAARRWPTRITREQYQRVTGLDDFIPELKSRLDDDGVLPCYANGEISFRIKGIHVKVRVMWNYEAPEGAKDTHFAMIRGTKVNLVIRQGAEQNYRSELYIEPVAQTKPDVLAMTLSNAIRPLLARYAGMSLEKVGKGWHVIVPQEHRIGHEAHFGQVTERFLQYLVDGRLPEWELANMKAKYYVTTTALEMAK